MMIVYKRYENASFDGFINDGNVNIDFLKSPQKLKDNVIIYGDVGTGKTYLAYAILNLLCEKKITTNGNQYYFSGTVEYCTIKEIIDQIRQSWTSGEDYYARQEIEKYKTIPLLIIDEIGVQYGSQSERIELFDIFNARYNQMLPIIAITNYNKQQLTQTLGLRIADRLFSGAKIIELNGKSKR